jgi:hypothetical protein
MDSPESSRGMTELHPQLSHHTKEAENHERNMDRGSVRNEVSSMNAGANGQRAAFNVDADRLATMQDRV